MYETHQQATGVICKVNGRFYRNKGSKNRQKSKFKKILGKHMMLKTHQHIGGVIYEEIYQQKCQKSKL